MAMEFQGLAFFWSTTTALSTLQKIGQVTGFNGPTGSAAVIDVTHSESTAKDKLMGLPDEGQVTFDINFQSTDAGQIALQADRASRTKRHWCIDFQNAASYIIHCKGYVTGFAVSGQVDNKISASVTVENTGAVTYTTH